MPWLTAKKYKSRWYYLPNDQERTIKNYNTSINEKNFYDQPIDSNLKQYEEIRKLTTGPGVYYTTVWLLVYDYIKTHYRLIVVNLNWLKELDADPKAFQQSEFVEQLRNADGVKTGSGNVQLIFFLPIIEKIKKRG